MNIRCYRCGWSFSLSREALTTALDEAHTLKARHYDARCPKCRQTLKVSVEQLKRAMPGWKPTGEASSGEAALPAGAEKKPEAQTPPETPAKARGKVKARKSK